MMAKGEACGLCISVEIAEDGDVSSRVLISQYVNNGFADAACLQTAVRDLYINDDEFIFILPT